MIAKTPWLVTLQFKGKRPFYWGWLASSEARLRHDISLFMPKSVRILKIELRKEAPAQFVDPNAK